MNAAFPTRGSRRIFTGSGCEPCFSVSSARIHSILNSFERQVKTTNENFTSQKLSLQRRLVAYKTYSAWQEVPHAVYSV